MRGWGDGSGGQTETEETFIARIRTGKSPSSTWDFLFLLEEKWLMRSCSMLFDH